MPLTGDAKRDYQRRWVANHRRASFMAGKACAWCGSDDQLELHHRDPNRKVAHAIWTWSEQRRAAEIAKCIVLCRPCHERGHAEARRLEAQLRNPCGTYASYKRGCRCESCRAANRDYQAEKKGGGMTERKRTAELCLGTDLSYESFGNYLAGLADGEGCFVIATTPHAYRCEFIIHLRADDRPLLEWLRECTALGSIYLGRRVKQGGDQPSVRWSITRRSECLALVALFEEYQLRSKKARDFALWAEAVRCWSRKDFGRMAELYLALKATRAFEGEPVAFVVPDPQMEMEIA